MKLIYSLPALLSVFLFLQTAHAAPSAETVQCEVPAMKCAGCSWGVTEELKKLEGVTAVYVDWKSKKAILEVDSVKVPGKAAIFGAVKTAGHSASNYKRLGVPFSKAKKELEKSS